MWLYGMEDTPRWCVGRSQPFNEHAVGDWKDRVAGIVEPPRGNVGQNEARYFGDVNLGTPEKELAK